MPRSSLSTLGDDGTRSPLRILDEQNSTRVRELVPLRVERMSASPFAFYRGAAAVMAADLATEPRTGILVPSCGDAHIANFGFYASPQRTLLFDLNDFDEAGWAPWEWDLKRLLASVVIAGSDSSRDDSVVRTAARTAVLAYARAMSAALDLSPSERYFTHLDPTAGMERLDSDSRRQLSKALKDARRRTGERATRRLTAPAPDGRLQFIPQPPTMTTVDATIHRDAGDFLKRYLDTVITDVRQLMQSYEIADVIRRVVGVGSVGTRCFLAALQDGDGHALIMQAKEANRSVLEQFGGIAQPKVLTDYVADHGEGSRVVGMQRVLQAVSDPFLGYLQAGGVDLYVRQFHDMKGGIDAEAIDDDAFVTYAQACAITLARAHSQSPQGATIAGYLGRGSSAADALLEWAYAYAARSQRDYEDFITADASSGSADAPSS